LIAIRSRHKKVIKLWGNRKSYRRPRLGNGKSGCKARGGNY